MSLAQVTSNFADLQIVDMSTVDDRSPTRHSIEIGEIEEAVPAEQKPVPQLQVTVLGVAAHIASQTLGLCFTHCLDTQHHHLLFLRAACTKYRSVY